jgi:hypothetical protein
MSSSGASPPGSGAVEIRRPRHDRVLAGLNHDRPPAATLDGDGERLGVGDDGVGRSPSDPASARVAA